MHEFVGWLICEKVLSEMTDERTKSVGTVEVWGVWIFSTNLWLWSKSGRIYTILKTNECPLKGTISMGNICLNFHFHIHFKLTMKNEKQSIA